jgi:hypothetical protein
MPTKPTVQLIRIKKRMSAERGKEHHVTASSTNISTDGKVTITGF